MSQIRFEGPRRHDLLGAALRVLSAAEFEDPAWLARHLLSRCLIISRAALQLDLEAPVSAEQSLLFGAWLARFCAGEPLAYLEGSCGFYGRKFLVDARVLVPRPDSESLIEAALELLPVDRAVTIADVGVGSGCLLLTLLAERPASFGYGLDLSQDALAVAQLNGELLGLQTRCQLLQSSWLDKLPSNTTLDLIISNPPYIEPGEELGRGVAEFEPHLALFTHVGAPLEPYRAILHGAKSVLRPGGWLIFEVGAGRAKQVAQAGREVGFTLLETRNDLGGVPRAVVLRLEAISAHAQA